MNIIERTSKGWPFAVRVAAGLRPVTTKEYAKLPKVDLELTTIDKIALGVMATTFVALPPDIQEYSNARDALDYLAGIDPTNEGRRFYIIGEARQLLNTLRPNIGSALMVSKKEHDKFLSEFADKVVADALKLRDELIAAETKLDKAA